MRDDGTWQVRESRIEEGGKVTTQREIFSDKALSIDYYWECVHVASTSA